MPVESINAFQQMFSTQKKQITTENSVKKTEQTYGSSKDIAATLGVLASLGIATVAIVKSKNAKKIAHDAKSMAGNINRGIEQISDMASEGLRAEQPSKSMAFVSVASAKPEQKLITEWESYTPDRLAKSPALRARKKEIKKQLIDRGYKYDRETGQFEQVNSVLPEFISISKPKKKKFDYNIKKTTIFNDYLKTLPKSQKGARVMNDENKNYIVENILNKEFNKNSHNIDELIEDSRTLKRFHKSIMAKVCGEDSAKNKLHKEIDTLINAITARIDTIVKIA